MKLVPWNTQEKGVISVGRDPFLVSIYQEMCSIANSISNDKILLSRDRSDI